MTAGNPCGAVQLARQGEADAPKKIRPKEVHSPSGDNDVPPVAEPI